MQIAYGGLVQLYLLRCWKWFCMLLNFFFNSVLIQAAHGFGSPKPGDRVCRFYSDMRKSCQSKCVDLTEAEVDTVTAARRNTNTGTVGVNVKEIQNAHIDPILFIKCVGTKTVTSWDDSQGTTLILQILQSSFCFPFNFFLWFFS